MKDTGIVRRIDELGRIVIPKEIRKTLRLNEGTQMQIYINETGGLMLTKYSSIHEVSEFADEFCQTVGEITQKGVLITDNDLVISCFNVSKKDFLNKNVSSELENMLKERKTYILNSKENATPISIIKNDEYEYKSQIIVPIIVNSDIIGSVILISDVEDDSFTMCEVKILQTISSLFSKIFNL